MMPELLLLLLPVAAVSGWWFGWRSNAGKRRENGAPISSDYFRGLNYLLNEQPDRAIDVFTRMIEVNGDTLEVHFALANLFLKRGEVDRAIRIHQNIIARPNLTKEQRSYTLYQLGQDYMRAGVLDRAEGVFADLINDADYGMQSQRRLIEIYQQEREWGKAIDVARQLSRRSGEKLHSEIAHFYCELAMAALEGTNSAQALKMVKEALSFDRECARASIIEGGILQGQKKFSQALRAYQNIGKQDPTLLAEVVEPIANCYREMNKTDDAREYLQEMQDKFPSLDGALMLAALSRDVSGDQEAVRVIAGYVQEHPSLRGLMHLLDAEDDNSERLRMIQDIVKRCQNGKARYSCRQCGFSSQNLYWQCPGCKRWDTVRLIDACETK